MKTLIVIAGHKIVNDKVVVFNYTDEIEWDTLEEKKQEIKVHYDWLKECIEKDGLIFHSEALKFYDFE